VVFIIIIIIYNYIVILIYTDPGNINTLILNIIYDILRPIFEPVLIFVVHNLAEIVYIY